MSLNRKANTIASFHKIYFCFWNLENVFALYTGNMEQLYLVYLSKCAINNDKIGQRCIMIAYEMNPYQISDILREFV